MPKYREIHTKITQSFDFNEMPDDFTRLLWVMLPLCADREGRGIFNGAWLRSHLFPLNDQLPAQKIMDAMQWFANRKDKMIEVYEVDGRQYFEICKFKEYQKGFEKEAPSELPPNPNSSPVLPQVQTNSRPTPDLLPTNSGTDSDSDSDFDSEAEAEEVKNAQFSQNISKGPSATALKIFTATTGMTMIPASESDRCYDALNGLTLQHPKPDELVKYLKPFHQEYVFRYPSSLRCPWLYDWAVAGKIPPRKVKVTKDDELKAVFEQAKLEHEREEQHGDV
jgi:hypothetical protein